MASSKILVALVSGAALVLLSACGDGSSNPSSGVGPEVQKEQLKDDQKGKDDAGQKNDGAVVGQDGKKDDGKKDDGKKDDGKKDDAIVVAKPDLDVECKKAVIADQFKKDCDARIVTTPVIVIPGTPGQGQGQGQVVDVKGGKIALLKILQGNWSYQGEACLPSQNQFTLAYAQGIPQAQWQTVVQSPGQGQGGVTVQTKTIIIGIRDESAVFQKDGGVPIGKPIEFGQIQQISADQNQGQAQIQLPHQQTKQDTIIVNQAGKAEFYVTEQNDACQDTGKVIQKFTK